MTPCEDSSKAAPKRRHRADRIARGPDSKLPPANPQQHKQKWRDDPEAGQPRRDMKGSTSILGAATTRTRHDRNDRIPEIGSLSHRVLSDVLNALTFSLSRYDGVRKSAQKRAFFAESSR